MNSPNSKRRPSARTGYSLKPAAPPSPLPAGLTDFLRARAAARYHHMLRVLHTAPAVQPYAMPQDGPIAWQAQARQRAELLYHTQLANEQARRRQWAAAFAAATPVIRQGSPFDSPEAHRRRLNAHKTAAQTAQNRADHQLEVTLGEGIGQGTLFAGQVLVAGLAAVRVVSGLRWAGVATGVVRGGTAATAWRAASVGQRVGLVEGDVLGARAAWQTAKAAPWRVTGIRALSRTGLDVTAQGGANYMLSSETGWERVKDAGLSVNILETGMAGYGIRPIGISVASAMFQVSLKEGYQSVWNDQVSWQAFGAQAVIGSSLGYVGEGVGATLGSRRAYRFYHSVGLRLSSSVAQPLWPASYRVFGTGVAAGLGVTEEYSEGKAQERWPASTTRPQQP